MKYMTLIVYLLLNLSHTAFTQEVESDTLPCALSCFTHEAFTSTCINSDADCLCADPIFQRSLTACVVTNCTIRESFLTHSITGNLCGWPYRDRSVRFRNICIFLLTVVTTFVATRVVIRLPNFRGPLGYDDYLTLLIWMLLVSHITLVWKASDSSLKKDIRTVPISKITLTLKYFSVLEWIYYLVIWMTKMSILLLYLRLFPEQRFRQVVQIGLITCTIAGVSFLCASIFQCFPVSFNWTFWDGEHTGKCNNIVIQGWAAMIINIVADIVVLVLPLPTIWKLNLSLEKRLSIMGMFCVGLFVTAVSVVRVTQYALIGDSFNETWGLDEPGLWSAIEMYVGVMCACMPAIRILYTQVLPREQIARLTGRKKRSTAGRSSTANQTVGSGRPGNLRRNYYMEFSTATENFEDPCLWQEEFELAKVDYERGSKLSCGNGKS